MLLSLLPSLILVKRSSHSCQENKQTCWWELLCWNSPSDQSGISHYQRYDPLLVLLLPPHHGVALACSCLTVCKYAHIVSLKGVKQHLLSDVLVHLHLGRIVDVFRLRSERKRRCQDERVGKVLISTHSCQLSQEERTSVPYVKPSAVNSPWCVTSKNSQSWSSCSLLAVWDSGLLGRAEQSQLEAS